jgi:hypothetical protein
MVHRVLQEVAMMNVSCWYHAGIGFAKRYFSWLGKQSGTKKSLSQDFLKALSFSGLDVEPADILLFAHTVGLLSFFACLAAVLMTISSLLYLRLPIDLVVIILCSLCLAAIPFGAQNLCLAYPGMRAKVVRIRSLGDVPEVLSYLVMYLKIVPNLENSVKFAAMESKTMLAADLRKLLWDMEIRVYHGIDDALTAFSAYWGQWHEYLQRSLHLVKASVCEHNEVSRAITLDRALEVSLDGTKDMMNKFVNALHQPTMVLYSVGIMIPLSLVAMLPAAGLVGLHLSLLHVFLLYDILIPLAVGVYMWKILLSRPAAFSPPIIPSSHPDLQHVRKKREAFIGVVIAFVVASPFILSEILPGFSSDVFKFVQRYIPLSLFFIWGVAAGCAWYCLRVYTPYKKIRDGIKAMEREFGDALYVFGKRLAEDRSPEESIQFTAQAMKGTRMAEVFVHTGYLLQSMNISLREAFFHPEYGSLKYVSSDRIKALTRLIVEGIAKSQQAVSLSIIRIADHLKELQDVELKIKDMLNELTSTLRATTTVFAPLIAGVTLSITSLIASILGSVEGQLSGLDVGSSGVLPVASSFAGQNIEPELFILVIGVYVLELVVLLTRFTNGVNEGDDGALFWYSVGRTMVVSVVVFSVTVVGGRYFFAQLVPLV